MNPLVALIVGVGLAAGGGDLFVRGIVGAARRLRVSPAVIAATFAAFATSSPELTISVTSALAGTPQIALGDALGSNVVNVALVLGLAVAIAPMRAPRAQLKRDFSVALAVPAFTALAFIDGELSRIEAFVMIAAFAAWLAATALEARRQRREGKREAAAGSAWIVALQCIGGIAALILGARLIVTGATGVAESFGVAPFAIGATLVALGTSAPEIATTIVARFRRQDEVGLGTLIGSNIFNGLLIVGVAGSIHPIDMGPRELAVTLGFGLAAVIAAFSPRGGVISRRRGAWLLAIYVLYVLVLGGAQAMPE